MAACSPHLSGAPPGHQCTLAGRRLSDLALSACSCRTDAPRRCCRADSRSLQEARSGAGANAASRGRAGAGPEGLSMERGVNGPSSIGEHILPAEAELPYCTMLDEAATAE